MATSEPLLRVPERVRPHLSTWWRLLLMPVLFLVALVPRTMALGRFVTVDEAYHWFDRAADFLEAMQHHAYARTDLVGHPGVTTMWLGAAGVLAQHALAARGWFALDDPDAHRTLVRLPVGIATALCVALAYPLLRRLFNAPIALIATLLWATEPFLVAHSQLLHVDALLTSCITLALLAAMLAFGFNNDAPQHAVRWPLLLLSGVAGGLALLTKSPSIILVPFVGLIATVALLRGTPTRAGGWLLRLVDWARALLPPSAWFGRIALPLVVWLVTAAMVWVGLWPAAWVALPRAIRDVVVQARSDGGSPHAWGNFFFGQPVADPGLFFYPVVIALRLTPWTLLGVIVAVVALAKRAFSTRHALILGLLFAFVLLFSVIMSVPPKKFDRYILPVFPALAIIAAAGLVWLWQRFMSTRAASGKRRVAWVSGGALALVACANLAWYHPYELAYYNQLLGGGALAARLIPVGWGEGYEQVGAYIAAQPDGADRPVAAWFAPVLDPYVQLPVGPLRWASIPGKVDYAVLYIDQMQRNDEPATTAFLRTQTPVYTVQIHGIDYAYVYRLPPPVAHPLAADFGPAVHLRGYAVDATALRASGSLTVTLQWQAQTQVGSDYNLFIHLLDAGGNRIGQVDVPAGGARAPTHTWNAGRYVTLNQRVPVPDTTTAGTYWIALGVYDPQTFARLPVRAASPSGAPSDGQDALLIGPITLP